MCTRGIIHGLYVDIDKDIDISKQYLNVDLNCISNKNSNDGNGKNPKKL